MPPTPPYSPVPGDILACWGSGLIARTIQLGTWGGPSHVALVVPNLSASLGIDCGDAPQVLESTSLSTVPCCYRKTIVRGLQLHNWPTWLAAQQSVYAIQLRPVFAFRSHALDEFAFVSAGMLRDGAEYDVKGAVLSWTTFLKLLTGANVNTQFCSENVALLLSFLNRFPVGNPAYLTPAAVVNRTRQIPYFDLPVRVK